MALPRRQNELRARILDTKIYFDEGYKTLRNTWPNVPFDAEGGAGPGSNWLEGIYGGQDHNGDEGNPTPSLRHNGDEGNPTPSLRHSSVQDEWQRLGEGPHLQSPPHLPRAMDFLELYSS